MNGEQTTVSLEKGQILQKAAEMAKDGYRLVLISCLTVADGFEVIYSFDRDCNLLSFRVVVPRSDAVIPSIMPSYFCAFTYENEIQDMFGIKVAGLGLDFKGNFYRKAVQAPMAGGAGPQAGA